MKKNIKKLISLYLCLSLEFGVLLDTVNAKIKEPIQLGDYIYASIDSKTLNVTGEGEMYNNSHNDGYEVEYDDSENVFYGYDDKIVDEDDCSYLGDYADYITNIVFDDGITSIGDHAFTVCNFVKNDVHSGHRGLKSLKYVSLCSTIETIGEGAFYDSSLLESIEIPSSVKTIKNCAFLSSGLKTVKINKGVENIGDYAFANTKLTEVNIPGSVKKIGKYAFNTKTIDTVVINKGVKDIDYHAFSKITAIFYSKDVKITEGAFCPCSTIICYKDSTADKYAKKHNIVPKYIGCKPAKAKAPIVSSKNGKLTVTCQTDETVFGYRIRYSTNKSMESSVYRFCKSLSVSGLEKGKKYYVQVRTYSKDKNGNKIYGDWSKKVAVVIK